MNLPFPIWLFGDFTNLQLSLQSLQLYVVVLHPKPVVIFCLVFDSLKHMFVRLRERWWLDSPLWGVVLPLSAWALCFCISPRKEISWFGSHVTLSLREAFWFPPPYITQPFYCVINISFIHSFIHTLIHSLISLILSFIHSVIPIWSFTHSFTHSLTQSLTRSVVRSFADSSVHPFIHLADLDRLTLMGYQF